MYVSYDGTDQVRIVLKDNKYNMVALLLTVSEIDAGIVNEFVTVLQSLKGQSDAHDKAARELTACDANNYIQERTYKPYYTRTDWHV